MYPCGKPRSVSCGKVTSLVAVSDKEGQFHQNYTVAQFSLVYLGLQKRNNLNHSHTLGYLGWCILQRTPQIANHSCVCVRKRHLGNPI